MRMSATPATMPAASHATTTRASGWMSNPASCRSGSESRTSGPLASQPRPRSTYSQPRPASNAASSATIVAALRAPVPSARPIRVRVIGPASGILGSVSACIFITFVAATKASP
jgi:hypothetical protein